MQYDDAAQHGTFNHSRQPCAHLDDVDAPSWSFSLASVARRCSRGPSGVWSSARILWLWLERGETPLSAPLRLDLPCPNPHWAPRSPYRGISAHAQRHQHCSQPKFGLGVHLKRCDKSPYCVCGQTPPAPLTSHHQPGGRGSFRSIVTFLIFDNLCALACRKPSGRPHRDLSPHLLNLGIKVSSLEPLPPLLPVPCCPFYHRPV